VENFHSEGIYWRFWGEIRGRSPESSLNRSAGAALGRDRRAGKPNPRSLPSNATRQGQALPLKCFCQYNANFMLANRETNPAFRQCVADFIANYPTQDDYFDSFETGMKFRGAD
jgi:hypothetical protein